MDPRTQLDYALFQLTPTRTRCDLVIFAGKKSEKIASGLLEPFISHLKSAKDQISKGGYSITLKPTSSDASSWFSKATLERFVRFVSTPEVLERFVTTEREINQIESSIESNEHANGAIEVQGMANMKEKQGTSASDGDPRTPLAPSKFKVEPSCDYDAEAEEKPKIRLQRVLETRKAMLKKEQAMAYARALVAGFEMDSLYDLVSFSDAFGALRLREACINFMELCKKKNDDKIWMDEVAAMQASYLGTSGITLAGENNDVYHTGPAKSAAFDSIIRHGSLGSSEGTDNGLEFNLQQTERANQLPTWPNHLPQYMQNPQGPMFQQIPSYPGYIFPGMQVPPSHYPGNVPWPANFPDYLNRDINESKRSKPFNKKKGKFAKDEGGEVDQSSSGSDSNDEQDNDRDANLSLDERVHNKKQNRRSSRKVVIRNINYITKGRNEEGGSDSQSSSCDEEEYVDAGSIKQQVEAAVGSLKRQHKSTAHRNKVRDGNKKASNKSKIDFDITNPEEEKKDGNWDIFQNLLMKDSDSNSKDMDSKTIQVQEEYSFQKAYGEELSSSLDKPKYASDDFILTERSPGNGIEGTNENFEGRENFQGVFRRANDEDLLMPSRSDREYHPKNAHFGNESSIVDTQKEEDWIVGSKPEIYSNPGGTTDHNIFNGERTSTNRFQIGENKRDVLLDDSFMVQSRLSDDPLQTQPKADIFMAADIVGANQPGNSRGNAEAGNFCEPEDFSMMIGAAEKVVPSWNPEMDYDNDISMYETVQSRPNTEPSDIVDATPVENGSASKNRNSKETGRKVPKSKAPSGSLVRSKSDIPPRSKLLAAGSKGKAEKEDEKKKRMEELLIQRQKRIAERSAAKGTPQSSKMSSKENKKIPISTKTEKAKLHVPTDENKTSHKPVMRSSTIDRLATARPTNKQLSTESKVGQNRKPNSKVNPIAAPTPIKKTKGTPELQKVVNHSDKIIVANNSTSNSLNTPIVLEESRNAEETLNAVEEFGTVKELHTVSSVEKKEAAVLSKIDASEDKNFVQVSSDSVLHSSENELKSTVSKTDVKCGEKKKLTFSPEISVMNISTPPEYSEMSPEHSRKKWNNGESSPKIPRGFRRLLLFGRRS